MMRIRKYKAGDEPVPGFRLVKFLGSGHFGDVWKASAPGGTSVAIKINNLNMKGALKEFRALRLVKQIQHPNLVPILALWLKNQHGEILEEEAFDQVADESRSFSQSAPISETTDYHPKPEPAELTIAMGLGHKSLADRLKECNEQGAAGIPVDELLSFMQDSARALDYLNNSRNALDSEFKAIQHCDVKPSNILIVGDAAQVCDFGLAREVADLRTTSFALTPAYAAPEMIETNVPSPTTDQYSLAISYVELRTGKLPFSEDASAHTVVRAHLDGTLDLSGLPTAEREVIKRATDRRPENRYSSVTAMVLALRDACFPRASRGRGLSGTVTKTGRYAVGDEPVPGYRLTAFLGSGGFGEVWTAAAPGGTQVAIKINKLGMKGAFKEFRSLKLVKRIHHPNLVPILALWLKNERGEILEEEAFDEVGTESIQAPSGTITSETIGFEPRPEPAELVIAMGLGSKSLAERLEECRKQGLGGIPLDELLKYLQDAARALDYLNTSRDDGDVGLEAIQHCDVKPSNILIVGDAAQVCDFGLAREVSDSRSTSLAMSLAYASAEMVETNVPSPATDQYSLAITYHELRTGELPFPSEAGPHTIVQAHLGSKLDLSKLPPAEREVIRRATARNPAERYPSATAMVAALYEACYPRALQPARRSRWWWAAVFLPIAAAVAVLAIWPPAPAPTPPLDLPVGFEAADAQTVLVNNVRCPVHITSNLLGSDDRWKIHLRLVTPDQSVDPPLPAFYVMANKVSMAQFERFVQASAGTLKESGSGDAAATAGGVNRDDCDGPRSATTDPDSPVVCVSCFAAGKFACWLDKQLGNEKWSWNLPTTDQWDWAAGRAGTNRDDARNDASDEINEWTRTPSGRTEKFSKCDPNAEQVVYVRGGRAGDREYVEDAFPDMGFRFVVEVRDLR